MQSLQDTLQQLRQFKIPLNPPATIDELTRLQALTHHPLPAELRALYLDHNGHDLTFDPLVADDAEMVGLLFRLLSIAELDQVMNDVMRTHWFAELPEILDRLLPCWSDDNSNYMVYYLDGPLLGRIAYLDHELGFDIRLEFRSMESFYASLVQAAQTNSYEMGTDYPSVQDDPTNDTRDSVAFDDCLGYYRQAPDAHRRLWYAFEALSICPLMRTDDLYELLADANAHVQGEICQLLGARKWRAAIHQLGTVAQARRSLSFVPALDALGAIPDPAAAEELLRVAMHLHPYDLTFVVAALQQHDYQARIIPQSNGRYDTYEVKHPSQQAWIHLRGIDVPA